MGEDALGVLTGTQGRATPCRPPRYGALAASTPGWFASSRRSISEAHCAVSPPPHAESLLWGLTEATQPLWPTERMRVSDGVLQPSSGKSLLERRLMEGGLRSVQNKQRCPGCYWLEADLPEASVSEQHVAAPGTPAKLWPGLP